MEHPMSDRRLVSSTRFLSATKLKIRPIERECLIRTLHSLRALAHGIPQSAGGLNDLGFDMDFWVMPDRDNNSCNTTACIAGWMTAHAVSLGRLDELMRTRGKQLRPVNFEYGNVVHLGAVAGAYAARVSSKILHKLFYDGANCSPQLAAERIDRFLTTGK
jgi:hypothetical protein